MFIVILREALVFVFGPVSDAPMREGSTTYQARDTSAAVFVAVPLEATATRCSVSMRQERRLITALYKHFAFRLVLIGIFYSDPQIRGV
jgi:hypothetical protein